MEHYLLWAVVGFGLSAAFLMRVVWLPDPPPDWVSRFIVFGIAGIVGGIAGGWIGAAVSSDPMPGIIGAIAGAFVLVAVVRGATGTTRAAHS